MRAPIMQAKQAPNHVSLPELDFGVARIALGTR
jgi:hypothetical protein